jgi:hypothetical protein
MSTSLKVFVVCAFVFLLAGAAAAQTDVVIAIDLSKSMRENDRLSYRFVGADVALTMFAFYGSNNRGGVVSFGDDAQDAIPLEHLAADQFEKYKPILDRMGSEDWTELGKGLARCQSMMSEPGRKRSIILISDGKVEGNPHVRGGTAQSAKDQAEKELWNSIIPALKSAAISVYAIGLFKEGQGDEKTLRGVATQTGGFYTHVEAPEEFPQIYKRMLDDIDHPSGVAELTNGSSIQITAFDQALIVLGPTGFVLKSPNNLSYSTGRETPDSPVKQKSFEYNNQTAILFLGRPDNIESNGQFWNGRWSVEGLNGRAEATFISKVRLLRDPSLANRREYFLNEYYPIQYHFMTEPGLDADAILSKCRAKFILTARRPSNVPPVLEDVTRQGNVFTSEALLNAEGDYTFNIKIYYDNVSVERWTQSDNFHVSKMSLVTISNPDGPAYVGSKFRIEAQPAAFGTAALPEVHGLVDSAITYSLRYGSDPPTVLGQTKEQNGIFRSDEQQFTQAGDLEIQGLLDGNLLMQLPGPNGQEIYTPYKVKALISKKVNVKTTVWATVWKAGEYSLVGLSAISALLTIGGFLFGRNIQKPVFDRLDKATLMSDVRGVPSIRLKPQKLGENWQSRWLTFRPAVSVGGPQSSADIKDPRFGAVKGRPVFEFSMKDNKYYITRTGALDVRVEGRSLEPNQPRLIAKNDEIDIPEAEAAKFKFNY